MMKREEIGEGKEKREREGEREDGERKGKEERGEGKEKRERE